MIPQDYLYLIAKAKNWVLLDQEFKNRNTFVEYKESKTHRIYRITFAEVQKLNLNNLTSEYYVLKESFRFHEVPDLDRFLTHYSFEVTTTWKTYEQTI